MAHVVSVNTSPRKTVRKQRVGSADLELDRGFVGDAHAGDWHRQVSLLAQESIDKMVAAGLDVGPADFAENLTTIGVNLLEWPVGTRFRVGEAELELSQIGKVCHNKCAIYHQAGDCVMPSEGIFAVVRKAAPIKDGDKIELIELGDGTCDRTPRKLLFSIITCSDTRELSNDHAGNDLELLIKEKGWDIGPRVIVRDKQPDIEAALIEAADVTKSNIIFTLGGTGFSKRDVTPEATRAVIEREAPGVAEAIRAKSLEITERAMLSRAIAGIRGDSIIINFPGSQKAASEAWGFIYKQLDHAVEMLEGGGH